MSRISFATTKSPMIRVPVADSPLPLRPCLTKNIPTNIPSTLNATKYGAVPFIFFTSHLYFLTARWNFLIGSETHESVKISRFMIVSIWHTTRFHLPEHLLLHFLARPPHHSLNIFLAFSSASTESFIEIL